MDDKRRQILKGMVASMLTVSSPLLLAGCGGIVRKHVDNGQTIKATKVRDLDELGRSLLYFASLAPSGHNAQPWSVRVVNKKKWIIESDPNRRLPVVDPDNRAMLLGIGAFLENLSLASGTFGYDAQIEIIAKSAFDKVLAKVTLKESQAIDYPLKRIIMRRTLKTGLLSTPLKRDDINILTEAAGRNMFYFPRSSKHAKCIEEAQVEAYRAQTYRTAATEELKDWFRLSEDSARKHRDGLTTEGMEIKGIQGWIVRNFMKPEDMVTDYSKELSVSLNETLVREGAGWFVITSKTRSVADTINTGRKFERMALMARERNMAIAPMTQLIEEESGQWLITSKHTKEIIPQMVLRVGYVNDYPDPVSLRRPVDWFVKS